MSTLQYAVQRARKPSLTVEDLKDLGVTLVALAALCVGAFFVLLLVELGIGLVGRVAPQLNIFVFAQPVKSLLASLMLLLFMYFLFDSLREFLKPENGVLDFLRNTL